MQANNLLSLTKRIGTGLSFIIFPIVFVFAFSVHPGLLHPHLLLPYFDKIMGDKSLPDKLCSG
jgi:hypothetical protein